MARFEFKLPDIGEGIAEAEIVAWHVKVGDDIDEDQQIADLMTDKATVEMESPVAGRVIEVRGEVGDQIPIGSVLIVVETVGESAATPAPSSRSEEPLADGMADVPDALDDAVPVTDVQPTSARKTLQPPRQRRRSPW
jgi:2-oxoisovalerate dehydrogenase E2 component (dihydrolipoyl transacylase)